MALTITILANLSANPHTMGGNARIMYEFVREWAKEPGVTVRVCMSEAGREAFLAQNVGEAVQFIQWPAGRWRRFGPIIDHIGQTIAACWRALRLPYGDGPTYIYSTSDFWPEVLPALAFKLRHRRATWIGSLFLVVPNPLRGYERAYGRRITFPDAKLLAYFVYQRMAMALIRRWADVLFITNDMDRQRLAGQGFTRQPMLAIYGGISLAEVAQAAEGQEPRYDGVFVGRLHPQKGVTGLVRIWAEVCRARPGAQLLIIGNGAARYEAEVRRTVTDLGLSDNVHFAGYVDGVEKYRLLKASKVFLHSTVYDNCGMAACEAMAAGLPVVMYDLPELQLAYPRGALKAPIGDERRFAALVLDLLADEQLRATVGAQGREHAKGWAWSARARNAMQFITSERHKSVFHLSQVRA